MSMKKQKKHILSEKSVQKYMRDWLYKNGWDRKFLSADLREQGVDIEVQNSKRHFFLIECKGSGHYENDFINSLGQICTRMKRIPKGVNYGIALPSEGAKKAVKRIPKRFAINNRLNVFSVSDTGKVKRYKPSDMR